MAKFDIDADLVRRLSRLLEETGLSEIEYEAWGRRIRVARQPVAPSLPVAAAGAGPAASAGEEAGPQQEVISPDHPGAVLAPVVGTVYAAPEPGAPPFVRVGDTVSAGQTLLIIEAMKTMNPVPAPRGGEVKRILVEDGTSTEYGEVLMIVE
jgi:acetyl-CoA carboxylase biotin carboxyl carrier protein